MVSGKDSSNPLMADSLPKIIWYSTHHITLNEELTSPKVNGSWANSNWHKLLLFSQMNWCCSLSAVSEGFNQIINFLNGSSIKYALTVNQNIYVSCIKQFWTTVAVKQVNDVTRLQALVNKKKVVVTEATIREALRLDDAEGVDCLPNEEIFIELARMGYEKPSTKLTFYKAFLSSQWKRVGKGFFGVETPLFEGMLVEQQGDDEGDADENVEKVNAGDAAYGDVSAAHGEVPTVTEEPSIPSPTPPTPPPQPPQDIPSTSQERMIAEMDQDDAVVLKDDKEEDREVVDAVKDVEEAKVNESAQDQGRKAESQAEIYKIDMDHANKVLSIQEDETEPAEVQEVVDVVTAAKLIIEVVTAANETITAASAINTTTKPQVPVAAPARVVAAPSRRRKGVVIRDPKEESTTSTIIPAETKSKDKAIDHVKRKAKEDPAVKRYHMLKRKPQTEAQARKNMMMYLKNVVGIKMDYFKGMSYDDIHPIFEEDLEALWSLIWKNQRNMHGLAKVKGWKLLESCGVQIITFTSTQLILLVERKSRFTRFTLDQMLNVVRLEVEEESEVSLELLRFTRQRHQEGQLE
nr:hypothetical protein [Tanacetum cinerariifolium]